MTRHAFVVASAIVASVLVGVAFAELPAQEQRFPDRIDLNVPTIASDRSIRYDYDIVYVRAPRRGDDTVSSWAEISHPVVMEPGADLMLLHPDGSEEMLVEGGKGAVADPAVSLDGQWVFYSYIPDMKINWAGKFPKAGADIYKINLKTRKTVRLTQQKFTPNTGAADWSSDFVTNEPGKTYLDYGVFNMGSCPLPGGRLAFTSNRDAFRPPKHNGPTLQLFVMDDDGRNVERIGYLNVGMALHPVVLKDGRIIFSSMESQGLRNSILWGLWSIHPDGTAWGPVISAFDTGGAPNAFHFQAQLSDGSIIAEEYYNQNNSGFGAYFKLPPPPVGAPKGYTPFGPGWQRDDRNPPLRFGRFYNSKPKLYHLPFSPFGVESFTRFANNGEGPADLSVLGDKSSPTVGKFTHPSAAPDNNLLTVYTPGPANHQNGLKKPAVDGGLYLIKGGKPIDEPAQMRLIKNDPNYNEQWPRAVVPYERIYGVKEPATIPPLANDGKLSPELPDGTPFGLVGTSSLYKRESYPEGRVPEGGVTAAYAGGRDGNGYRDLDPFNTSQNGASLNWFNQGSDAGLYSNDDIHAVRILAMEPTTDRHHGPKEGRLFASHANERLRILGEVPVRKFVAGAGDGPAREPLDPDGNPDTSFLVKIPADTPFTFQTLDKNGMVLNMAQTWHQLRPGEIRNNCGGCHAHSQKPTLFELTAAAKPGYKVMDLAHSTPLLTDKSHDQSGVKWDAADDAGLRIADAGVVSVEYFRDVQPILKRSCVACHTEKGGKVAAGDLNLDADDEPVNVPNQGKYPGTYYRLAMDEQAKFGFKPVIHNGTWRQTNASRYIRQFQSRRSLIVWKVYGKRLDGWSNDDFPTARVKGDPDTLELAGKPIPNTQTNRDRADLDFRGSAMPPEKAIKEGKVQPLSDEDRRTLVRWIDLGCPIDLDYDADHPDRRGFGWMCDDKRPTLTVTYPKAGANDKLDRILVGMADYYSGLDPDSFTVTADFAIDGVAAGQNLAPRFKEASPGVFELKLAKPVAGLERGNLTVAVRDRQGNVTRVERTLSVK
jgi:Hydrazine synthase alpha subunit middle domain